MNYRLNPILVKSYDWKFNHSHQQQNLALLIQRNLLFSISKKSNWNNPKWLLELKINTGGYLEMSRLRILDLKKWAISEFCHVIEILCQFESEPSQNLMHMPSCDNISYDDFLSHFKIPPVMTVVMTHLHPNTSVPCKAVSSR